MSEPNHAITPELALVEEALRGLHPQSGTFNRDRVMFDAGRAAVAPRTSPWWKWGTIGSALTAIVFAGLYFVREPERVVEHRDRVVEVPVYVKVEVPILAPQQPDTPPSSEPRSTETVAMEKPSLETVRMMQIRRDVLRWGPEILPPAPRPSTPRPDPEADLTRWLNLPPGTLTAPYTPPTWFPGFRGDK